MRCPSSAGLCWILNTTTYSVLAMLEIIFPVELLLCDENDADMDKGHETIDLLKLIKVPSEEHHNFLSNNPEPRHRHNDEKDNGHPFRRAIAIMPIIITKNHADKIIFPETDGNMDFTEGEDQILDFITNLDSKCNKVFTKENGSMVEVISY